MAGIVLDKAKTSGHDMYPPTVVNASSSTVKINGKRVVLHGDPITPHTKTVKPHDTHGGTVIATSSKLFIEGKAVARLGDKITCGDVIVECSSDVSSN